VAPEKTNPVEPIVLFDNVCGSMAKTKVSEAPKTGMVIVLGAVWEFAEIIVVLPVDPRVNWLFCICECKPGECR